MFNRGVDALLQALPSLPNLSIEQVRRLLTGAWLEATDVRSQNAQQTNSVSASDLRRLATALEIHAILPLDTETATVRACAFVAAEALTIANEVAPLEAQEEQFWLFGSTRRFERVEAGLLYLIAGYDANAALTLSGVSESTLVTTDLEAQIAEWALTRIRAPLTLSPVPEGESAPDPPPDGSLRTLVRHEIWRRIGSYTAEHVRWLTFDAVEDPQAGAALRALVNQLGESSLQSVPPAQHADLHHLTLLLGLDAPMSLLDRWQSSSPTTQSFSIRPRTLRGRSTRPSSSGKRTHPRISEALLMVSYRRHFKETSASRL